MKNLFEKKEYELFLYKSIRDTFVYNSKHFDIIVVRWNGPSLTKEYDTKKQFWNIYIRFMPSFPNFNKITGKYFDFDLIPFAATYYKKEWKTKVFGNDYVSSEAAIRNKKFDASNHVFFDAHRIIEELLKIVEGADKNGKDKINKKRR